MSSKPLHLLRWPLALVLGVSLAACGRWIDGKKKEDNVIELKNERLSCLNALPGDLNQFIAGEAEEPAVRGTMGCLRDALTYFSTRTRGSLRDAYTSDDLRAFFGKYFLRENNVSPELAEGFMRVKAALLGGSDSNITKAELERLIGVLKVLEDTAVRLAPHMKILLMVERNEVDARRLEIAVNAASAGAVTLMRTVDLPRSDYTFGDAMKLMSGLATFVAGSRQVPAFERAAEWLPVIEAGKNVLFGEQAAFAGAPDWFAALRTLVDIYDVALRYHYLVKNGQFTDAQKLRHLIEFSDRALSVLENSHQMRRIGRIPFRDIDILLERSLSKLPGKPPISTEAIKDLYRRVVLRIFDPVRRGDGRGADSFERAHLLSMRREFNVFRLNQAFIDSVAEDRGPQERLQVLARMQQFSAAEAVRNLTRDSLEQEALLTAWEKYKLLMSKPVPVVFNEAGRLMVTGQNGAVPVGWRGLVGFNMVHSLVRLFMLGYGDNGDPIKATCTEDKLSQWWDDFKMAAMEAKVFDPRFPNSGPRSHKEASFFTYSGDGNANVNMDEMFEYLGVLVGGGFGNLGDLRKHMDATPCALEDRDVFGDRWLDEACFKKELRHSFGKLFANLPGLVKEVEAFDDAGWEAFYDDLMKASRVTKDLRGKVESGDLRTAVVILHYAESLFVVYDRDGNGGLSIAEVKAGAPRFRSFILPLIPDLPLIPTDWVRRAWVADQAFQALVFLGRKPTDFSALRAWITTPSGAEAHRSGIFKVFAVLKDELGKKK